MAAALLLVLVRHGKAEAGSPDGTDRSRALAPRGAQQAADTAAWLAGRGLGRPDLVLVSPALRTAQTWEAMAGSVHPATLRTEPELYETSAQALAHLLAGTPPEVGAVLVVGHEPVLSDTAGALAGEGSDGAALARVRAGFPTGSAAVLELDGPWSDLRWGSARLVALHRP